MTHTLLVTKPVQRYIEPRRKLYSLYRWNLTRWVRIAESSFYLNTARFVYSERIFNAARAGIKLDIRPISE